MLKIEFEIRFSHWVKIQLVAYATDTYNQWVYTGTSASPTVSVPVREDPQRHQQFS